MKRYHRKSKNGCKSCRERRVKCNEVRPTCQNCVRRKDRCTWYSTSESSSSPPESPSSPPKPPCKESADIPRNPSPHSLDMLSLELLHNYVTNTVYSIASRKGAAVSVLEDFAPRMGFSYPPLMHAILAVSALHLCILTSNITETSSDMYSTAAVMHFRAARAHLPPDFPLGMTEPIALTRCFLAMYIFAFNSMQDDRGVINALVQMRALLSGVFVYKDTEQYLGPLNLVKQPSLYAPFPSSLEHLSPLSFHVFPDYLFALYPEGSLDGQYFRQAVQLLKDCWIRACVSPDGQIPAIFRWIEMVPEGYVSLLKAGRPEALIVLAHHHTMALLLEHQCWWIWSSGRDALKSIFGMVDGVEWEFWSEWPRGVLRGLEERRKLL